MIIFTHRGSALCRASFGRDMAKPFAKKLYHSKKWQKVRAAAIIRDKGMCQYPGCNRPAEEVHHIIELTPANIDDPAVALAMDNLMSVCRDCHFKIHREKAYEAFQRQRKKRILKDGLWFDENGMIKPMEVYIIHGAPGAGKNRYVEEHREAEDLVVDLDSLLAGLGQDRNGRRNLLDLGLKIREFIYDLIEERDESVDCHSCWIIATLPKREEREALASRLRAELIHIDTDQMTCVERAKADPKRHDKQLAVAIVEKYFEKFEP